jgi:uncharacterized protein
MGSKHPFAVLLLLIVAIVASTAIFSDVYRWVDDDGVEHFGNKPPTQSDSTLVSTHDETAPQSDDTSQTIEEIDRALISGNFEKAFQLLKPLAEEGHPRAQNGMAVLFDGGLGVPQDLSKAAKWYRLSAEQGYAKAQFNLGVMYAKGEGVPRNPEKAAQWYLRAAEQGHAFAQHNLASMYLRGEGVTHDIHAGVTWEKAAAEQGDPNAQYSLGLMYFHGQGVTKDPILAYDWISKGMANGHPVLITLESGWKVGHHARDNSKGEILEFVRINENIDSWTALVTVQRMPPRWGGPTPEATVSHLKTTREQSCPGTTIWNTIKSNNNMVIYEWQSYPCSGWPSQHEIAKIVYQSNARFIIHYAAKEYRMSDETRLDWLQRLAQSD